MNPLLSILLAAVIGTVVVAVFLNWQTISSWFVQNRDTSSKYGALIKQSLGNGKYTVIGGIFSRSGQLTNSTKWEDVGLDQALLQEFGAGNELLIDLTV
jgi:hypothetical protein